MKKKYQDDLSDKDWKIIKRLIPKYRLGRKRKTNISDCVGGKELFTTSSDNKLYLKRIWADGSYRGKFKTWLKKEYSIELEIVKSIKYKGRVPKKYEKNKCPEFEV